MMDSIKIGRIQNRLKYNLVNRSRKMLPLTFETDITILQS